MGSIFSGANFKKTTEFVESNATSLWDISANLIDGTSVQLNFVGGSRATLVVNVATL